MLIGFLRSGEENLATLGPEFQKISERDAVIDLDKFADRQDEINARSNRRDFPPVFLFVGLIF